MSLLLDFETRSTIDLRKTGVYVYAEHPTTDVWCAAYAVDDGPIEMWTPGQPVPGPIMDAVLSGEDIIAHNAQFERLIWRDIMTPRYGWPKPALSQWVCTMAMAYAMSLPGSLENAAAAVGLDVAKDMAGHRLMMQMARPRRIGGGIAKCRRCDGWGAVDGEMDYHGPCTECHGRGEAEYDDVPVWWDDDDRKQRLFAYCRQDVEVERQLEKRLVRLRPEEQRVWMLDQLINDRGVHIDADLCLSAKKIVQNVTKKLDRRMAEVTDGAITACSQVQNLIAWLKGQGVDTDSVAKAQLEDLLAREDLTPAARHALELRREAAKTSTAKINAMLTRRQADGRARGNLQYHGAGTGRWAARGIQLQNLPRPDKSREKEAPLQAAIDAISTGSAVQLEMLYDRPLSVVSDVIRSMVTAGPGNRLWVRDFSNIEGRVVAWLAGQNDKLERFRAFDTLVTDDRGTVVLNAKGEPKRRGPDLYLVAAAGIFGCSPEEAGPHRQIGKVAELALGFQGGVRAFAKMATTYGLKIGEHFDTIHGVMGGRVQALAEDAWEPRGQKDGLTHDTWVAAEMVKIAWRDRHPKIVDLWNGLEEAAIHAVENPGQITSYGKISYRKAGSFLWCRLPSGRCLCYPYAQIVQKTTPWGSKAKAIRYKCVDQFTRRWDWKDFYGGLATENVTQAVARDVMVEAMLRVEAEDYPIVLTVHDEVVAERADGDPERFTALMEALPAWAKGLPVSAAGYEAERYRKG